MRFSPQEIQDDFSATFTCRSSDSAEQVLLQISVNASAKRPWCHFELQPSDYRGRRVSDAPLDPKYQIIEFESLGTRVKNTKRFYVLNPTAEEYEFQWLREELSNKS